MSLRNAASAAWTSSATVASANPAATPAILFMASSRVTVFVTLVGSASACHLDDARLVLRAAAARDQLAEHVARRSAERCSNAELLGQAQCVLYVLEPQHGRERDVASKSTLEHAPSVAHDLRACGLT